MNSNISNNLSANVPRNVKQVDFRGRRGRKTGGRGRNKQNITYPMIYRKIVSDIAYIKNSLNVEDKYNDVLSGGAAITNTAVLTLLNGLSLGNTSVTRTGQSIKSIDLQLNMAGAISTSATSSYLRVMVFRDTQPNAAAPTAALVLAVNNNFLAPRLVDYNDRFMVLVDQLFAVSIDGPSNFVHTIMLPLGFHTLYNTGNVGTVADITKNSLYLMTLSNEATNGVTFSYYSRFSYVDN